jgi:hypothetical protein
MAITFHLRRFRVLTVCRRTAVALLALLCVALASSAPSDSALMTDQLRAVAHQKECRVTTAGRRTGNPHTVTTWFVADGDTIYLGTLDETRDWVRNARASGHVTLDFGSLAVTGTFGDVTDPRVDTQVRHRLQRKYWMAWIGGWFGRGPARTFRVGDVRLAAWPDGA